MAKRRHSPRQTKSFAADAAILITAAIFSLPAFATTNSAIPCPKSEYATLIVAKNELVASKVSHDISYITPDRVSVAVKVKAVNPVSLLAPRAEAAIKKAFRDNDADSVSPAPAGTFMKTAVSPPMAEVDTPDDPIVEDAEPQQTDSGMTTRLPGVSDNDLARFKKQMFRRDI